MDEPRAAPSAPTEDPHTEPSAPTEEPRTEPSAPTDEDRAAEEDPDDGFELDDAVGAASTGPPACAYDGKSLDIPGLPTRADLVRDADTAGLARILDTHIAGGKTLFFMPTDVVEENQYVNGVPVYKLHLFGILQNGAKTHVILDNIDVYLDVRVPDRPTAPGGAATDFGGHLRQVLVEQNATLERLDDHLAFPIKGYRKDKVPWKRPTFSNLQARKKALETVRSLGYETASDDRSSYYRMVARVHGLVLADWGLLTSYEYFRGGAHADGRSGPRDVPDSPLCEHVIRVDVRNFRPLVDPMAPKEVQEKRGALKRKLGISRDKTLVLTWDIETRSTSKTGDLPRATNATDHVFMVSGTLHWKDDPTPLHRFCIVDVDTEPDMRWTTIVCGTEESVVKAVAVVFRHFAPDIVTGFNDMDYDWPFVMEKARQFLCLGFMFDAMTALPRRRASSEEGVLKWNLNVDKKVKISAEESALATYLKVPGCVPVDVRIMFRQLFPKAEVGKGSSLNFYLKACNLSSKADMPYKRMWEIRDAEDAEQMRHVAHYCVIDAKRCQDLLVKRNVVNDRREVAALSYVSLFDAVFYAGGHKVGNMLMAYAIRRGLLCSNINNEETEEGQYPGAVVFHPEKGLTPDPKEASTVVLEAARAEYLPLVEQAKTDPQAALRLSAAVAAVEAALEQYGPGRPTTGLDFSSLYPSIIMTYNLSPEKYVESPEEAARLRADGADLHKVEFLFQGRTVRGWFVRHQGEDAAYGLYPSILIDLFDKRALMKVKLGVEEELKEHMEVVMGLARKSRGVLTFPEVFAAELAVQRGLADSLRAEAAEAKALERKDARRIEKEAAAAARNVDYMAAAAASPEAKQQAAFQAQYRETCFEFSAIDSKQKALKGFMNTFYGEAGNKRSAFFLLPLAGGVTTAGQYNIKMVADYVIKQGFRIKYGDTDSLYVCAPARYFKEADRRYAFGVTSREEYWTEMVRITMEALDSLRDKVNAHLCADNGTKHLKMAYEEVIFPGAFTGKKKYFGIAHVNVPNFRPKKLFIKGIDVVKLGQTELAKKIGYRIMWEAVSLTNAEDLQTIVEVVLKEAIENNAQWSFDDFIQSDAWKPAKDNKSVQRFMGRMRARVAEEKADNDRREARGLQRRKGVYYIPDAGERFKYVLVKPGASFDMRGLKAKPSKGDVMEYEEVARAKGLPIDVSQYLVSYVVGLCARFINYAGQFLPPAVARQGMDEKALDKKSQDAAKKYLTVYLATLQNADPVTMRKRGYAYKRAWKGASQECGARLFDQLGPAAEVLHGDSLIWSDFLPAEDEDTVHIVAALARAAAAAGFAPEAGDYVVAFCKALGIGADGGDLVPEAGTVSSAVCLYGAAATFTGARRGRGHGRPWLLTREAVLSALDRSEAAMRARLEALAPAIGDVAARYEAGLAHAVSRWRGGEHKSCPDDLGDFVDDGLVDDGPAGAEEEPAWTLRLEEGELALLEEVRALWYRLVGIYRTRAQHQAIVDHLAGLKDRRQRRVARPDGAAVRRTIAASARRLPPLGVGVIGDGGY